MRKYKFFVAFGFVALAASQISSASAQTGDSGRNVRAFSTNAEVAYKYGRGGSSYSVHVKNFTHPSTGVYCIQPSVKVNLNAVYPLVTINLSDSNSNTMLAYWVAEASACPAKNLQVQTYDFGSGTNQLSDGVAFNFVIE